MKNLHNEIRSNQNVNGGGMAVNITGRYESNRKALADLSDDKKTAGEAAKEISKYTEKKILAKELILNWKLLTGREPEWHHAGFYKGKNGKRMGRTFYFTNENIKFYLKNIDKIEAKKETERVRTEEAESKKVFGFYYSWEQDRGDKKKHKVLHFYKGNAIDIEDVTEVTEEFYKNYAYLKGKKYIGWDEPSLYNISECLTEKESKKARRNAKARARYAANKI